MLIFYCICLPRFKEKEGKESKERSVILYYFPSLFFVFTVLCVIFLLYMLSFFDFWYCSRRRKAERRKVRDEQCGG